MIAAQRFATASKVNSNYFEYAHCKRQEQHLSGEFETFGTAII